MQATVGAVGQVVRHTVLQDEQERQSARELRVQPAQPVLHQVPRPVSTETDVVYVYR